VSITVNISTSLQAYTNTTKTVETEGSTVSECLQHLGEEFPRLKGHLFDTSGELVSYYRIFVNRKIIDSSNLDKPIKDGDELSIMMMGRGG